MTSQFKRLERITASGTNPGRRASPASSMFVKSFMDFWKDVFPAALLQKMKRFHAAHTSRSSDRSVLASTRAQLCATVNTYKLKLTRMVKDLQPKMPVVIQTGGMRTLDLAQGSEGGGVSYAIPDKGNDLLP